MERIRISRRRSTPPSGPHARGIAQARQVQGKELSYNNLNDANAALELVVRVPRWGADGRHRQTRQPLRRGDTRHLVDAWREALACDSVSAFGGIVATNRPLDAETAEAITQIFTEVVVAPDAEDEAKAIFARRRTCACC